MPHAEFRKFSKVFLLFLTQPTLLEIDPSLGKTAFDLRKQKATDCSMALRLAEDGGLCGVLELVAKKLGAVMGDENALRLALHNGPDVGRQLRLQRLFVIMFGVVLAAFDFGQDALIAAAELLF